MGRFKGVAASLAAVSLVFTFPATASAMSQAEKLRRLDIMLMVTGLRCRKGADNFQADYQRFTANHITELNLAANSLKNEMAGRFGAAGATRALDRLSVTMANAYGQGHPWLDCAELKVAARNLADARGTAVLEAAADQLLSEAGATQVTAARR